MPKFRRYYVNNAMIFITQVTRERRKILGNPAVIQIYWETLRHVQQLYPFNLLAYVILPDHFHWLLQTDPENPNFSKVLHSVKRNITLNYKKVFHLSGPTSIWQPRFWDHVIRNETDLNNHFDYIHYNPVKHGYISHPEDWKESSFSFWYQKDYYPQKWGWVIPPKNIENMNFD